MKPIYRDFAPQRLLVPLLAGIMLALAFAPAQARLPAEYAAAARPAAEAQSKGSRYARGHDARLPGDPQRDLAPLAQAQPVTIPPDTTPPDTIAPIPLAPLVVTVLRSSLDLTRVPAAVTVADATLAARSGPGLGLDDALLAIPGLQVDNRYNYSLGERVSIRGFGARSQFGVRGIRVVVDGVPATLPDGQTALDHVDLAGIGRAEILRGAASSLYGNAAGGVIQLESMLPPAVPFHQEFRTVAGSDGLLRLESRTGGEWGRVWYGLDATRLTYDGYRENSAATNTYAGGRLGYRGDRDDLRLVLRFVDLDAQNPGALSDSLLAVDRRRAFPNNLTQRTGKASRQLQLGGSWRRTLEHGDLEVAAYGLGRQVENPTPPQVIDLDRAATGARIVYRGAVGLGTWATGAADIRAPAPGLDEPAAAMNNAREIRWTVGIEGDRQRDDRANHGNVQGGRGALTLDQLEWVTGIGLFGQLTAPLTARLTAQGGLRYDTFRFRVDDRFPSPDGTDQSGRRTMAALSPSFGVIYSPGRATNLYANFGTSFQTPTTTELANRPEGAGGFNPALQPERTRSFEAGLRGVLDGRTTYQLAAYHARTRNALIGFEVPAMPGRTFYRNAGSAVHRGVEAEATALLMDDVALRLAYTLTDARFGSYRTAGEVLDGKRVPGVAPHRAEASLRYRTAGGYLELWGRALAGIPADDQNNATSPAYALAGVRGGVDGVRVGGVEVAPFAGLDNLFGQRYNAAVSINAFGGRYYEPGPGRTFFAGARVGLGGR
jgi:iron complex outermembrane receptor protein